MAVAVVVAEVAATADRAAAEVVVVAAVVATADRAAINARRSIPRHKPGVPTFGGHVFFIPVGSDQP